MWVSARAWMAALLAVAGVSPLPSAAAATSGGIASLTARPLPMVVDGGTLEPVPSLVPGARLLAAVRLGGVRLLDNLPLESAS